VNRRTRATLEDNSWWQYGYNDRNELTNAQRHWYDSAWVSGQQFGYAYDNIGNRQTASFGGDVGGNNLQTISYTANSLNQYTSIVTPGQKDICGAALVTNSVTVNSVAADRKWEYYHRQVSIANTNQPVWQGVTVNSGSFSTQGGSVFPANNQTLAYDADGNLTFDGVWNYQWDGENRLISMNMTNVANIANANRLRLDFAYDFKGRRVQKIVSTWNGSAFANPATNLFVYDGWNLLAILNAQSSILQSFMWGNDLSGTITKAGGVGGLLMASLSGTNCFTTFDGNGNITALINASDKSTAARYEYSSFHEMVRATGPLAHLNPFRSSSKFWDDESGLVYYGMRYYSPTFGRWLSKDPSEERSAILLYAFVRNSPLARADTLGNTDYDTEYTSGVMKTIREALDGESALPFGKQEVVIYAQMLYWFSGNIPEGWGIYDYKSLYPTTDTFAVPGYTTPFSPAGFGNYLACYAGAYASVITGAPSYLDLTLAAGDLYTLADMYDNDQYGDHITLTQAVGAFVNRLEGVLSGSIDGALSYYDENQ